MAGRAAGRSGRRDGAAVDTEAAEAAEAAFEEVCRCYELAGAAIENHKKLKMHLGLG
jgi:hypothetical protein